MVLAKFRQRYPQGSLVSELVDIDRGTYIVGVSVIVNDIILATGLAGANTVETAEDLARERAIALLMLDNDNISHQPSLVPQIKPESDPILASSQISPPVQATQSNVAKKPFDTASHNHTEDSNVLKLADYPPKQETKSEPGFSSPQEDIQPTPPPAFTPETETTKSNAAVEDIASEPLHSVPDSPNLFAGTSNPDLSYETVAQDNQTFDSEVAADAEPAPVATLEEVNFNEIKHQTDLEIKRLGWTKDDGREFLKSRYGKRSRLQLTDDQLLEFLQYLASQPSPG